MGDVGGPPHLTSLYNAGYWLAFGQLFQRFPSIPLHNALQLFGIGGNHSFLMSQLIGTLSGGQAFAYTVPWTGRR